jgi:hypothetical protein
MVGAALVLTSPVNNNLRDLPFGGKKLSLRSRE